MAAETEVMVELTHEEADLLYALLSNEAEFHRNDEGTYSEVCLEIAQKLEPSGV